MQLAALANGAEQTRSVWVTVWDAPRVCTALVIRSYHPVTTQFRTIDGSHKTPHGGRDYGVPSGTPIYAAEAGTVSFAGNAKSAGNAVIVNSPTVMSRYYHLQSIVVTRGQPVSAGQLLGYSGKTGHVVPQNGGDGSHLHFEQWKPGSEPWIDRLSVPGQQIEPCTF